MSQDKIEEGDIVTVEYGKAECVLTDATVLHVPQAPGDAWHLIMRSGSLVYVQTYDAITRVKP